MTVAGNNCLPVTEMIKRPARAAWSPVILHVSDEWVLLQALGILGPTLNRFDCRRLPNQVQPIRAGLHQSVSLQVFERSFERFDHSVHVFGPMRVGQKCQMNARHDDVVTQQVQVELTFSNSPVARQIT